MRSTTKTQKQIYYIIGMFILLICSYKLYYYNATTIENFVLRDEKFKAYYINLDKNKKRNADFLSSYEKSDMQSVALTRFPAIIGKTVDFDLWLKPEAIDEMNKIEKTRERTHHYQLTHGGVGCFLSHYTLAKQLLEDPTTNYYIIFEDDIGFHRNSFKMIDDYLLTAPEFWDIILFSNLRKIRYSAKGEFLKPDGFWGMQSYIINKKGAQKLVEEVQREKIDGQIDAYLSRMIQQNKINIYITNRNLIYLNQNSNMSDIQSKLRRSASHVNPFDYKGYIV